MTSTQWSLGLGWTAGLHLTCLLQRQNETSRVIPLCCTGPQEHPYVRSVAKSSKCCLCDKKQNEGWRGSKSTVEAKLSKDERGYGWSAHECETFRADRHRSGPETTGYSHHWALPHRCRLVMALVGRL